MLKRFTALLMALCMLMTGLAFAEGEDIPEVEEEVLLGGEEELDENLAIGDDVSELMDDLHLDVEIDDSIDPETLELNPNLPDHVVNILLIGIDTRSTELGDGLQQADVQLILSLNKQDGSVKITSIQRDLYVQLPGYKNKNRINLSYARGGGELAMRTVNNNFDMNIEYYATINFYGLASIIDSIGGIDIDMTKQEAGHINFYLREHPPTYDNTDGTARVELQRIDGVQHLDGVQAVMYARIRAIDNDFARTARQRKLLELLLAKVMKDMDIDKLMKLIETSVPYVETNMGLSTMLELALGLLGGGIIQRAQAGETLMEQHRIPADGTWKYYETPGGASVVAFRTDDRKKENIQLLHEFIYGQYYPAE